ncbi:hypothetical protein ACSBR2_008109 [Camellia fascicularis]
MAMKLVLLALLMIKNASADEQTHTEKSQSWVSTVERILYEGQLKFLLWHGLPRPRQWRPWLTPVSPVPRTGRHPDVVVAQDGSGNCGTIKEALDASLDRRDDRRFVIYVKSGTYNEYLVVTENMKNVMLCGDGIGNTIITGSHSARAGYKTWKAATVVVSGDGFVARDITFRNTAGREAYQAPALASNAPHSAFYRCSFEGYQDTLYVQRGQQFYRECEISGTVDFICGNAAVVIQNSNIYAKRSRTGNEIVIAASNRNSQDSQTGIVIHNCRIMAGSDLKPVIDSYKIYLGRPWRPYARTIYIQNDFDLAVDPKGWVKWKEGEGTDSSSGVGSVDFREYGNRGMGASTSGRVRWSGYRATEDSSEAEQFSVANFIQGDSWLPGTGIPFTSGL